MEFACNVSPVVRLCEPEPCRGGDLRGVSVLLGVGRRGRSPRPTSSSRMAVGGEARRRRALRDARDDVFEDGDGGVGDGGGGVVVARRAGMMCASILVAMETSVPSGSAESSSGHATEMRFSPQPVTVAVASAPSP